MSEELYTEKDLSMQRAKPRSLVVSLGYRLKRLGEILFGKERALRFFLDCNWLTWRFAFEESGEIYGGEFHIQTKALNDGLLRRWIPEDGSVIDIGCGVGRWCKIAAKYADTVVGIDYDKNLIEQARRENAAENVEFLVGDVTTELDGRKFDLALLTHVIEHIDDADSLLKSLANVADKLIVEVPDFEHDPLNWVRFKQNRSFYSDGDHVREYTLDILQNQLKRNGWKVVESFKNGGAVLAVATCEA